MTTRDPMRSRKDKLIEENLKKAFEDKANEDVPPELLALLDKLKSQDEADRVD